MTQQQTVNEIGIRKGGFWRAVLYCVCLIGGFSWAFIFLGWFFLLIFKIFLHPEVYQSWFGLIFVWVLYIWCLLAGHISAIRFFAKQPLDAKKVAYKLPFSKSTIILLYVLFFAYTVMYFPPIQNLFRLLLNKLF